MGNLFAWANVQQIIRILLFTVGGWFLGEDIHTPEVENAIGGLMVFLSGVWWFFSGRKPAGTE